MRGKYINTTIMLALLACNKRKNAGTIKETIATTTDHKLIWSKEKKCETTVGEANIRKS